MLLRIITLSVTVIAVYLNLTVNSSALALLEEKSAEAMNSSIRIDVSNTWHLYLLNKVTFPLCKACVKFTGSGICSIKEITTSIMTSLTQLDDPVTVKSDKFSTL